MVKSFDMMTSPTSVSVACMTGDVIVFDQALQTEVGRTHFGGAVGHYNSLIVADIGGGEAIYAAGSLGLRRLMP
jgi:hypothetical protein